MDFDPLLLSDEELIEHAAITPSIFGYIIDRYEKRLDRYIQRISAASEEDREDILQDVFISVYQNINGYSKDMKFSSWIYKITHNKTISWWRKNKATNVQVSIEQNLEFIESLFHENSIQKEIDQIHLREASEYALKKIKREYRDILMLKFTENFSYDDLADMFSCSVGTIGTRISRAKKQFIKYYEEYERKSQN